MGMSTDAILVFGFDVGEESDDLYPEILKDYEAFEELILTESGLKKWDRNCPDDYITYQQKINQSCPIEIVFHCSSEDIMAIVAIQGTSITANRGYPEIINPEMFNIDPQKIKNAKEWCEKHNIKWQEPHWLLASYWG